jgi:hypothetical protein
MSTQPPDDWNDLDAPADDSAARLEILPPKKRRIRLLPSLLVISLVALTASWLGNLSFWPAAPSEADLARGRQAAFQLADKAVRDYALRHNGRYPSKLDDAIALPDELKVEYVPHPPNYELRVKDGNAS